MMTFGGTSLIAPVLPVIQESLHVDTESIGLVMAVFSLPGLIFIPITGFLSDRYGRRAVITPMLFLYGAAGGLSFYAPDFEILLVMRFLAGIGASALGALTIVLVGDLFEKKDQAAALGYRIAFGQLSSGILPVLGGFLALIGWEYPFLIFFLAVPVGLTSMMVLDKETGRTATIDKTYLRNLWLEIANRRTATFLTIAPTLMIVNQGITTTFIPLFMSAALGASAATIGIILAARMATSVLAATQLGRLVNYISAEYLVLFSLVLLIFSVGTIPLITETWMMVFPLLAIGLSTGLGFPAFQTLLIQESSDHARAAVISTNGVMNRIGQVAGPVLGGVLFGLGAFEAVYFGAALFLLVMAIFLTISLKLYSRRGPSK